MYSDSKEEKEFFEKKSKMPMTDKQIEYNRQAEQLTDRELQVKQAFYLSQINNSVMNIKNNVQFWFYSTIILLAIGVLILASK